MAVIKKDGNFMGLPMNVARGNPIPLDKSEIWYSYAEMAEYAASNPVAYVGQILGLVDETNSTATAYIILNAAGDLQEIGASIEVPELKGDNISITISEENETISLKNWGVQYYKYVEASGDPEDEDYVEAHYELQVVDEDHPWIAGLEPKVASENNTMVLAWYQPNPTTIEGLGSQLSSLQTSVSDLQTSMSNVYTKTETDEKIAEKVAQATHLKRKIVESVELIDKDAKDADQYIYMVPAEASEEHDKYDEYMVIVVVDEDEIETRFVEKVGSWEVDLDNYVTEDKLTEALKDKVDAEEGYSLISNENLEKLEGIEEGAQKNLINSVDGKNFSVDENGKLTLSQIEISKVTDLQTLLDEKVAKEEGKGLSTNDLTDALVEKINNSSVSLQSLTAKVGSLEELLGGETDEDGNYTSSVLKSINDGIAANSQSITSLTTLLQEARSDIGDLKTTTGAHTLAISTLEQNVTSLQEALGKIDLNNYVTVEMFENTVGSLDELQAQTSTLHTQVKELQEALTWTELTI